MNDLELFDHAIERYEKAMGKKGYNFDEVISFLENEIEHLNYKNAILSYGVETSKNHIKKLNARLNSVSGTSQLEAAQENTMAELIKALADNGYNAITINYYKDIEKERGNNGR